MLKKLLLPRLTRVSHAVIVTAMLAALTAAIAVDERGSFATRCPSFSDRF
ncbi:hypothetical protein ACVWWG_003855 [Bradyrhizobium sp. LB7.2]